MHYYKKNIGDYYKKAGRLSILEHGAYTMLLDSCYDREKFPTLDEAIDWCWARTEDEINAVKFVLSKFFDLIDGRYVQNRVNEEIEEYHSKADTNSRIAKEREEKRRLAKETQNTKARSVNEPSPENNEPSPNQEPRTKNQEPETNNQFKEHSDDVAVIAPKPPKFNFKKYFLENGCDPQHLDDWMQVRKVKKGINTLTAQADIIEQIKIAKITVHEAVYICAKKSWSGFNANWDWSDIPKTQSKPVEHHHDFSAYLQDQNIRDVTPTFGAIEHD